MKYLLAALFIVYLGDWLQPSRAEAELDSGLTLAPSARGRFALPQVFDFGHYKRLFNKHYRSLVQELGRQKLFLARAFAAFVSAVNYKYRRSDYYLGINQMSDETPEELAMKVNKRLSRGRGTEIGERQLEAVEPGKLEEGLMDLLEGHRGDQGHRDAARELSSLLWKGRRKRETIAREASIDEIMRPPVVSAANEKIVSSVPSNNLDYEPVELQSFGIGADEGENELPERITNLINNATGVGFLKRIGKNLEFAGGSSTAARRGKGSSRSSGDAVYVDHRRSQCFLRPRNQGKCGSCYIFTSVALLEWVHCMQTGKLVAFSEQYIIDCGFRFGLHGCDGGYEDEVGKFVSIYGLELLKNYPYRDREGTCPYPRGTDPRVMGYLKVADSGFRRVKPDRLERALTRRPIAMHVDVPFDFDFYQGGVHPGKRCDTAGTHAMLLVGSGRQDGEEYWLFRNSYDYTWGEGGYFKLNKKSRCIIENDYWTADVEFEDYVVRNGRYRPFELTPRHDKRDPDAPASTTKAKL